MWKCKDFFDIQILCEINFGEFRSGKIAVFAIFGVLNFGSLVNCCLQKMQKFIKIKFQTLGVKMADFALLNRIPKIDFT